MSSIGTAVYVGGLWLVLLTAVSMWWRTLKGGGRPALITSFIALPVIAVCSWLIFAEQLQLHTDAPLNQDAKAFVSNYIDTLAPANTPKLSIENREERMRAYANSPTTGASGLADTQRRDKTFTAKAMALWDQYKDASARIDWDSILDPDRLANDKEMTQSTIMVDAMSSATAAYVKAMHDLIDGLPPDISSGIKPEAKQLMFRTLALQQQETEQVGQTIDFLKQIKGQWYVSNKQILFQKQSDLDKFNEYLQRISITDSDHRAVEEKRLALANEELDRMKQIAK